jgi:hypothetical protein
MGKVSALFGTRFVAANIGSRVYRRRRKLRDYAAAFPGDGLSRVKRRIFPKNPHPHDPVTLARLRFAKRLRRELEALRPAAIASGFSAT